MKRPQLVQKLAKERARTSSRYEFLQGKQASAAEKSARADGGVSNTTFRAIAEPAGNGGVRIYVPKIARLNAGVEPGCAVDVGIRRVEA